MTESIGDAVLELSTEDHGLKSGLASAERQSARSMGVMGGHVSKLRTSMKTLGVAMTAGVTVPVVAGFGLALKSVADVDLGLHKVVSLTGETGSAASRSFGQFKDQVSALSDELGVAQSTLADGLYQAISAGIPRDNAMDFMRVASKAAIAGVTDTETAVDGLSTAMNAFKDQNLDAKDAADQMFMAVNVGKTEFPDLASNIGKAAPLLDAAKVKFSDFMAAVATMTSKGISTPETMTNLKAAMTSVLKPTDQLKEAYKQLGVQGWDQLLSRSGSMQAAFGEIAKASGGNKEKLIGMLGTLEGTNAVLSLTGPNAKDAAKALDQVNKSGGAAGKAFEELNKSDSRKFEQMKVQLQNVGITIGAVLMPYALKAAQVIRDLSKRFADLPGPVQKGIVIFAAAAAAIGPIVMAVMAAMPVIEALGVVIGAIASPIGLVIAAVAVLGVMWLRTGNHMEQTKQALAKFAGWMQAVAMPGIVNGAKKAMAWWKQNIQPTIDRVLKGVQQTLTVWVHWATAIWNRFGSYYVSYLKGVMGVVLAVVKTAFTNIGNVISVILAVLRGDWSGAWTAIKKTAHDALTGVVNIVKSFGPLLGAAAQLLWQVIKTAVPLALKGLGKLLLGALKLAWAGAKAIGPTLLAGATGLGSNIIDGLLQGIQAGAGKIIHALEGLAGDALRAAKKKLKIFSPSQVFRDQVGMPIADGIAAGIQGGIPGVLAANQKLLDATMKGVDAVKQQMERLPSLRVANNAVTSKTKAVKTAQDRYNAVKNPKKSLLSANQAIARAQASVRKASHTKSTEDDKAAALQLKQAKQRMALLQADIKAGKKKSAAALAAAKAELVAAQKQQALVASLTDQLAAAELAAQQAQDAVDTAQAQQDALDKGLSDIKDSADLALAKQALQEALSGGATADTMAAKIAALKAEYGSLQTYLQTNAANLSTQMTTDVFQTMADVLGQVNDLEGQLAEATGAQSNNTAANNGVSGSTNSIARLAGSAGSDTGGNLSAPLIGEVNIHDASIQVPQLMRTVSWAAKQVGAY